MTKSWFNSVQIAHQRFLPPERARTLLAVFLLLCGSFAMAQARPEDGGQELELWSGGGHSVPGGTSRTAVWNLGLRYGWILSRPHGPGFLKGRFEYAIDAVPAWCFSLLTPLSAQDSIP